MSEIITIDQSGQMDDPSRENQTLSLPSHVLKPYLHPYRGFRKWMPIIERGGENGRPMIIDTSNGLIVRIDRHCVDVIAQNGGSELLGNAIIVLGRALGRVATKSQTTEIISAMLTSKPTFDAIKRVAYLDAFLFVLEFESHFQEFSPNVLASVAFDLVRDSPWAPDPSEFLPFLQKRQGEFHRCLHWLEILQNEFVDLAMDLVTDEGLSWEEVGLPAPDPDDWPDDDDDSTGDSRDDG